MKKLMLLSLLTCTLMACEGPNIEAKPTLFTYGGNVAVDVFEYTIDSCQYIGSLTGSNCDWASHKGNCNNPIHKK